MNEDQPLENEISKAQDHQKPMKHYWQLIEILSNSTNGLTVEDLAAQMNVSTRTIRRYLSILQTNDKKLEVQTGDFGKKYWFFKENPVVMKFNYDEAAALYLGRGCLSPLMGTFLWEAANEALAKIRTQLGPIALRRLENLLNVFGKSTAEEVEDKAKGYILDTLIIGCEDQLNVEITYHSLSSPKEETYLIQPYELEYGEGCVYVIGYSCKSQGIRQWKLDRIKSACKTNDHFEKPENYVFESFASENQKPFKVRVLFDAFAARYVQERKWHTSEILTPQPDGSVIAEYELKSTVLIRNRILSYGPHAVALEPESLRNEMRETIRRMSKQYK